MSLDISATQKSAIVSQNKRMLAFLSVAIGPPLLMDFDMSDDGSFDFSSPSDGGYSDGFFDGWILGGQFGQR